MVTSRPLSGQDFSSIISKGTTTMAKCMNCGKQPVVGRNVSHSKRHTPRFFRPNLQKVSVWEGGRKIQKTLCTKCIKTMSKLK